MNPSFATTRWSLVRDASSTAQQRKQALSELYTLYWRPICDYLRRMGITQTEVEDLAQDFFLQFFDSGALDRANEGYGRFRAYLLGALRHHVQKLRRKAGTQKRGGGLVAVSLDIAERENPSIEADYARLFDLEWAQTVVAHSMTRLEQEIRTQTMDRTLAKALIEGNAEGSQQEIAQQLGISVTALKTRIFRLRRRFREILREEVARTVSDESELDGELTYLTQLVGGPTA